MNHIESKICIGNIDVKALLINDIRLYSRKLEVAEVEYHKATLNHNYAALNSWSETCLYSKGLIKGLTNALRYILAQEAERDGRQVSANIREFDEVIEVMVNGKQ